MDASLAVSIKDKDKALFNGQASAVTSLNDKGQFDILPKHANFISLIKDWIIVYSGGTKQTFPLKKGILKVQADKVSVFLQLLITFLTLLSCFLFPQPARAKEGLTVSGYGPPSSSVYLWLGSKTESQTESDKSGFFIFHELFLSEGAEPLCLLAQKENLATPPLCLTPPSSSTGNLEDILLPPLLSLSTGKVGTNQPLMASGFTFPKTNVRLFLFKENSRRFFISRLPAEALAKEGFPPLSAPGDTSAAESSPLTVKSDNNGYFELYLPTATPATYRIFVGSEFLTNPSPRSNLLTFYVLSYWETLGETLKWLLGIAANWFRLTLTDAERVLIFTFPLLLLLFFRVSQRWLASLIIEKKLDN
jgi:hypothetical protein